MITELEKKAKAYWRFKLILFFLDLAILISFLAVTQFTHISARLKEFSLYLNHNFYISCSIYLVILGLAYYLLALPMNFYDGFILEHRFSLSNRTMASWFKDDIKKGLISAFLFLILIDVFYGIARNFGSSWWIISSLVWIFFSIIFLKIFPIIIIPVFYKYNPLPNNELRNKMLELAKKFNIKVLNVFEIDFSKNTKKSNAAIVGWGDTRRVILADNLINEFTPEEIEVVVAHEMAHYKLNHIWKLLFFSAVSIIFFFFVLSLVADKLAIFLRTPDPFDIVIFPGLYLFFVIYGLILMPFQNGISRKLEKDADVLALKITGLKAPFISLMEKLAEKNLSDKRPSKLTEFLFYDHPPIAKRIEIAKKFS